MARPDPADAGPHADTAAPARPESRRRRGRRAHRLRPLTAGLFAAAVFVAVCAGAVGILRVTLYSPARFVEAYLDALAGHDLHAALNFPGMRPPDATQPPGTTRADGPTGAAPARRRAASEELLRRDMLGTLGNIRTVARHTDAAGRHRITVSYTLAPADGGTARRMRTVFVVAPARPIAGVLPRWRFAVSPLTVVHIEVRNAHTFTLAGHTLDVRAASGDPDALFFGAGDYLLAAPASITVGHADGLTRADPVRVDATAPGGRVPATVTARVSAPFTARVQEQMDHYLDSCAKQQVLQPAGCPMGERIDNRVLGAPRWEITEYPAVSIRPGRTGWMMPSTSGVATLSVRVQSLFDGSVTDEDKSVPFRVSIPQITIQPDGSLTISVAG